MLEKTFNTIKSVNDFTSLVNKKDSEFFYATDDGIKTVGWIRAQIERVKGFLGFNDRTNVHKVDYALLKLLQHGVDQSYPTDAIANVKQILENRANIGTIDDIAQKSLEYYNTHKTEITLSKWGKWFVVIQKTLNDLLIQLGFKNRVPTETIKTNITDKETTYAPVQVDPPAQPSPPSVSSVDVKNVDNPTTKVPEELPLPPPLSVPKHITMNATSKGVVVSPPQTPTDIFDDIGIGEDLSTLFSEGQNVEDPKNIDEGEVSEYGSIDGSDTETQIDESEFTSVVNETETERASYIEESEVTTEAPTSSYSKLRALPVHLIGDLKEIMYLIEEPKTKEQVTKALGMVLGTWSPESRTLWSLLRDVNKDNVVEKLQTASALIRKAYDGSLTRYSEKDMPVKLRERLEEIEERLKLVGEPVNLEQAIEESTSLNEFLVILWHQGKKDQAISEYFSQPLMLEEGYYPKGWHEREILAEIITNLLDGANREEFLFARVNLIPNSKEYINALVEFLIEKAEKAATFEERIALYEQTQNYDKTNKAVEKGLEQAKKQCAESYINEAYKLYPLLNEYPYDHPRIPLIFDQRNLYDAQTRVTWALKLCPKELRYKILYANTLTYQKKNEEAKEKYKALVSLDPQNNALRFNYALLLSVMMQKGEALKEVTTLCKKDPENALYWAFKGELAAYFKQPEEALEACVKAYRLNPNLTETNERLYNLSIEKGSKCYYQAISRPAKVKESLQYLLDVIHNDPKYLQKMDEQLISYRVKYTGIDLMGFWQDDKDRFHALRKDLANASTKTVHYKATIAINSVKRAFGKDLPPYLAKLVCELQKLNEKMELHHLPKEVRTPDKELLEIGKKNFERADALKPQAMDEYLNLWIDMLVIDGEIDEAMSLYDNLKQYNPEFKIEVKKNPYIAKGEQLIEEGKLNECAQLIQELRASGLHHDKEVENLDVHLNFTRFLANDPNEFGLKF